MNTQKETLQWIYIAKGLALVLVVIGHFYPVNVPAYWEEMRKIIYLFHMPAFFMLSGFLYKHNKYSYTDLIRKKVKRLIYPFLSIAFIFFVLKVIAGFFFNLEYPVGWSSLYALLIDPVNSYLPLLWFIHALILYFITYPLVRKLMRHNLLIILLLVLINLFLGKTYGGLNKVLFNFPFFIFGILLNENDRVFRRIADGKWTRISGSAVLFVLIYIIYGYINILKPINIAYIPWFVLGLLGSFFIINLGIWIADFQSNGFRDGLFSVGVYSMSIYLFHFIFESAVRILFLQIFTSLTVPFEIVASIAILLGLICPLLLEKYILRKNEIIKKYILGLG